MNKFQQTDATGMMANYYEKNIFKIIYDFIPVSVLIFILGLTLGVWMANLFHNQKIVDSIKLQRFLHKTIVYNITPNVEINK
jgi:hypothetical protein